MTIRLSDNYIQDPSTQVWSRGGYSGIAYNDGDEVEHAIQNIIHQAKDISVLSTELRRSISDWPTLYHLSSLRSNLLRPLQARLSGASILEIGAGCGAVTRYLGEVGADVLALEGTLRRAQIARSRTRDLANVEVVSERFDDFRCEHQFDVVTLIGVLEYANLFVNEKNPHQAMLRRVRSFLKPGGVVILAIENQLGLKYFAGANEDHLGQPFYGIEGRYTPLQPETFGREVLNEMILNAGFSNSEFLYPFPDYKLPYSVLSESGINDSQFDAGALIRHSILKDPQLPPTPTFDLNLAIKPIVKNHLASALSNSFLVVASDSSASLTDPAILAWHFSSNRKPEYFKSCEFIRTGNRIEIQQTSPTTSAHNDNGLIKQQAASQEYKIGESLSQHIITRCLSSQNPPEVFQAILKQYIAFLLKDSGSSPIYPASADTVLDGALIDANPSNILIDIDGNWHLIDDEWIYQKPLTLGFVFFRAMLSLQTSGLFEKLFEGHEARIEHIKAIFRLGLVDFDDNLIQTYCEQEDLLQSTITGIMQQHFDQLKFPIKKRVDYAKIIANHDNYREIEGALKGFKALQDATSGLDKHISFLNGIINGQTEHIKALEANLKQKQMEVEHQKTTINQLAIEAKTLLSTVNSIQNSPTWRRITALRSFFHRVK